MTSIREELDRKLNSLSPEQLDSVRQFIESLESQPTQANLDYPLTNEDIDRISKQNKQRPIGLAKGEFTIPDDFNAFWGIGDNLRVCVVCQLVYSYEAP